MKVLITTPEIGLPGGVAFYFQTLKPYIESDADYFTIGRRSSNRGAFDSIFQIVKDYILFFITINFSHYDVVHINPSLGSRSFLRDSIFVVLAKLSRKQVVVFFHGWDMEYEKFSKKYLLWLYKISYFQADAIVVLAEQFKSKIIELGYKGNIFVESTVVGDEIFNEFDLADKTYNTRVINILFLSRIEKTKGIYETIDTIKILNSKHADILLTVAGSGDELASVKKYASDQGIKNIKFTGYITGKEKHVIFKEADIYMFPTFYGEGMPISVLEAMAYGLPVITRPVGGLKDFFEDVNMGCLIDKIDPSIFANCVQNLIENVELREKISKYNREYSYCRFKAVEVAKRLKLIYSKIEN